MCSVPPIHLVVPGDFCSVAWVLTYVGLLAIGFLAHVAPAERGVRCQPLVHLFHEFLSELLQGLL